MLGLSPHTDLGGDGVLLVGPVEHNGGDVIFGGDLQPCVRGPAPRRRHRHRL